MNHIEPNEAYASVSDKTYEALLEEASGRYVKKISRDVKSRSKPAEEKEAVPKDQEVEQPKKKSKDKKRKLETKDKSRKKAKHVMSSEELKDTMTEFVDESMKILNDAIESDDSIRNCKIEQTQEEPLDFVIDPDSLQTVDLMDPRNYFPTRDAELKSYYDYGVLSLLTAAFPGFDDILKQHFVDRKKGGLSEDLEMCISMIPAAIQFDIYRAKLLTALISNLYTGINNQQSMKQLQYGHDAEKALAHPSEKKTKSSQQTQRIAMQPNYDDMLDIVYKIRMCDTMTCISSKESREKQTSGDNFVCTSCGVSLRSNDIYTLVFDGVKRDGKNCSQCKSFYRAWYQMWHIQRTIKKSAQKILMELTAKKKARTDMGIPELLNMFATEDAPKRAVTNLMNSFVKEALNTPKSDGMLSYSISNNSDTVREFFNDMYPLYQKEDPRFIENVDDAMSWVTK
ncbi:MAG: hypothetical protein JSS82_14035 [Bacteroidetes bacterium]|nr:hypothetical protein [Bacteroidota bacterium]